MNGKLSDVRRFIDVDAAILCDVRDKLGAFVVLLQGQNFEPVATIVLQRPCHKTKLSRCVVEPLRCELPDAAHLLTMGHWINDMASAL